MFACTLFDFNGVLVDDEHVHLAAFQDTLAPLGITLSEADYWDQYLGFDDVGAFEAILRAHGLPAERERVDELVRTKFPIYMDRAEQSLQVFEGAAALVARCASFGAVGVVSGALRPEIELGLRVLGVRSHVEFIVAAEDTERSKPDPEGYLIGLAKLRERAPNLEPRQVLVIEDSLSGIEAAKAAELTCVAVAHSYPEPELAGAGADAVVAHVRDVDHTLLERTASRVGV
ncbi:MAG: HAD family phosphatase [Myxococcales bacterium]|nr:HAD family phosphatase [Myxococcales bacterium]